MEQARFQRRGSARFDTVQGQRLSLQRVQIQPLRRLVDVKPNHLAVGVDVDVQPRGDLNGLRPRPCLEFRVEAVCLRIVAYSNG